MIAHYFRNFLRHCANNKVSTFIHIVGLSLGMAVCALLAVFVFREFSYDQNWTHKDQIFRINTRFDVPNRGVIKGSNSMGPLRDAMLREIPDVASAARLIPIGGLAEIHTQDQLRLKKANIRYVDPEFFEIFDVITVQGDLQRVKSDPTALAVTKKFAMQQFETEQVLGKTLEFKLGNDKVQYEIVAIVQEAPVLSDLEWQAFALLHPPYFKDFPNILERWYSSSGYTYVKLRPDADASSVQASLPAFIDANFPPIELGSKDRAISDALSLQLLPVYDMHLDSEHESRMKPVGDRNTSILYLFVAALVLAIACINFVNMSVARAMHRAREISIRKVLGASRRRVLAQITFESVLLAVASYGIALVWIELFAEPFFIAIERPTTIEDLPLLQWIAASFAFAALLGAISGLYPALVISRFQPARMLKSNQSTSSKGASLARSALIITQFVISSALLVATGVLWAQNEMATNIDLGYEHRSLIAISSVQGTKNERRAPAFKERLKQIPGVRSVALADFSPGGHRGNNAPVRLQNDPNSENVLLGSLHVDGDFFECLNVKMLAGHDLSDRYGIQPEPVFKELENRPDDVVNSHGVLNRSALKLFGFQTPQDAIGKRLEMNLNTAGLQNMALVSYEIVGVVEDLRFGSLHQAIRPVLYTKAGVDAHNFALVQLDSKELSRGLSELRNVTQEWFPGPISKVTPVDQAFYRAYEKERRDSSLMAGAGLAALGIAILGLFGLSMFVVKQQRKEIGIRKTFGASSSSIVTLMFLRFCRPLLAASVVGSGIGLYLVNEQLQSYTEHVEVLGVGLVIAALTVLIHIAVASLAVAPHTLKIANMHPREALRRD